MRRDSLLLRSANEDLSVSTDGAHSFRTRVPLGSTYSISIAQQPAAQEQRCVLQSSQGVADSATIVAAVRCVRTYPVSAAVEGLVGSGLELKLADGTVLPVRANGPFRVAELVSEGTGLGLQVAAAPRHPGQHCDVTGDGRVRSASDTIKVVCRIGNPLGPEYLVTPVAATACTQKNISPRSFDYASAPNPQMAGTAPQTVTVELGSPRAVTEVRFSVSPGTAGFSRDEVLAGLHADEWVRIGVIAKETSESAELRIGLDRAGAQCAERIRIDVVEAPGMVSLAKIRITAAASNVPQYFGYFGDSFPYLSPVESEIADHTNISRVSCEFGCPQEIVDGILRAAARGVKSAVAIHESVRFDSNYRLRPDLEERWNPFAEAIRPYTQHNAFLYPNDEPYALARMFGASAADAKRDLDMLVAVMKKTFPDMPMAFSFNRSDFEAGVTFSQPANPQADAREAAKRLELAQNYAQLASSDSSVVGLFGFIYQNDFVDIERFPGIQHWPELREKYAEVGRSITSQHAVPDP